MGAVAKTFPMNSPFAKAVNRLEWKSLWIIAALVLAAVASVFRDGVVEKFVSNSTPKSFNTREVEMRLDPTLIWNFEDGTWKPGIYCCDITFKWNI